MAVVADAVLASLMVAMSATYQLDRGPASDAPWHPVNARRTEVAYSFHCAAHTAKLSYRNEYAFDPRNHGKSVQLVKVRTSIRALTTREQDGLADFFRGFAVVENVKGRCYEGDFLIDITGVSRAALDEAAASNRRELPEPVQRTVILRKAGGISVPTIDMAEGQ